MKEGMSAMIFGRGLGLAVAGLCVAMAIAPVSAQTAQGQDDNVPTVNLDGVLPSMDVAPQDSGQAQPAQGKTTTGSSAAATTDDTEQEATLPDIDRSAAPAPKSGSSRAAPAAADADLAMLPLQPLGGAPVGVDRIVRMSGERATRSFTLNVPAPAAVKHFVLSYRISIDVLPERSQIQISVNGTAIDPITPDAFTGFKSIELPADLLVRGDNRIDVTVRQSHRIFCGPEASFQIWTEVNLNTSGVQVSRSQLPLDSSGIVASLNAQLALRNSIPVRLRDTDRAKIMPALSARLAALGNSLPVLLDPKSRYAEPSAAAPIARITILSEDQDFAEVQRGADGAMVLVISPSRTGGLPNLDSLLPQSRPIDDVARLDPGKPTSLTDLKFTDTEDYNRYSEQQVIFRLPDDWMDLASQTAMLKLLYGFADGLPENALLLVKANGTTIRLLPLGQGGGGRMQPLLDVGFPARMLHAGVNELTFEAIIPGDPPSLPCPSYESPLLTIDPSSTLRVPQVPKMSGLDLGAPLSAVRPEQVILESGASEVADQAAGALRTSLRAISGIAPMGNASLHVVSANDLDKLRMSDLGVNRRDLENAFFDNHAALADKASAKDQQPEGWFLPDLRKGLKTVAADVRELAKPGEGSLDDWLIGKHGDAALVVPDGDRPNELWLVLGPDANPVEVAAQVARARVAPEGPTGRFALLDSQDSSWTSWRDTSRPPVLREPLTLKNFRAVAGNYASWAPVYFVLVLMGLTVISVICALIFVVTTRGSRKQ